MFLWPQQQNVLWTQEGKTVSCDEDEVLAVSGMNRWFHRVKPASLFLSKMKKCFMLAQGWACSYAVSQLFVGEL